MARGGSWNNNTANARAAKRNNEQPGKRNNNLGFRLVFAPRTSKAKMPGCHGFPVGAVIFYSPFVPGRDADEYKKDRAGLVASANVTLGHAMSHETTR